MTTPSEEEARAALAQYDKYVGQFTNPTRNRYADLLAGALRDLLASRVATPPSEDAANDNVLFYLVHEASGYLLLATSDKAAALSAMQDGDYMVEREIPVPAVPVLPTEPADIESLRRTAQQLRADRNISAAREIEAVIARRIGGLE